MTIQYDTSMGGPQGTTQPRPWDDTAVPLELRGVSRQWLIGFVRSVSEAVNGPRLQAIEEAKHAMSHNKAGLWGRHDHPDLPIPEIPPYYFLNTHGLVDRVIKPMTASVKAPLFAVVPEEFRGRPTAFISHTWRSLLLGPDRQRIGTLDALEESDAEFVWVDFACYNQHTFEAIAADMLRVIKAIGSISVCATPTPIYTRCWCLWELLCAYRAETPIALLVRPGFRNDKIMSVNSLYRSFRGIDRAESSVPSDREMILNECLSHFGSIEEANRQFERLIEERFSSSWHELQDRNEQMKFSPTPWIAGSSGVAPSAFDPYFEPGLLDSTVFGEERTVRELFADAGVYLGAAEMKRAAAILTGQAMIGAPQVEEFFKCLFEGDTSGVERGLETGCDPEAEVEGVTPIAIAASQGDVAIVKMLVAAGAKIEPTNTRFSPLRLAADHGQLEAVQLLLRLGAVVDSADSEDGWTALMWASSRGHLDIVNALLERGAEVNHQSRRKACTSLHLAAQNGWNEVVRTLIRYGADIDACEYRGLTALHLAAYKGHLEIVQVLLTAGADRSIRGKLGQTALSLAEEEGHERVVEAVLSRK